MGREKLKVVIRCSWVLDNNGIEEPQIAKRRKGFEIIMQLEKARTENHNPYGRFWWCTRDHSHEHKWQKHCRVAFKYKNLYGEKTILCALCNWLTSLMLCVSSFLYSYGHFMGFISTGFRPSQFGVMAVTDIKLAFIQILSHSYIKETIVFAPYKFLYTELGATKKC